MAPRALNLVAPGVDQLRMDASSYAFVQGIRSTRATLENWNRRPWPVLRGWLAGSLVAAIALLAATLVTVMLAVPVLILTALWEVYAAPHVLGAPVS
jgi:hypothetical protein